MLFCGKTGGICQHKNSGIILQAVELYGFVARPDTQLCPYFLRPVALRLGVLTLALLGLLGVGGLGLACCP